MIDAIEYRQAQFTEMVVWNTLFEYYDARDDLLLTEYVDKSEKSKIKPIVKKLRAPAKKHIQKISGYELAPAHLIGKLIAALSAKAYLWWNSNNESRQPIKNAIKTGVNTILGVHELSFKPNTLTTIAINFVVTYGATQSVAKILEYMTNNYLWQIVGVLRCEDANITKIVDDLNEKFKMELGQYKFIPVKTTVPLDLKTILPKMLFGGKHNQNPYFIIIDRKLPKEIKEINEAIAQMSKMGQKSSDDKNDNKSSQDKTEKSEGESSKESSKETK